MIKPSKTVRKLILGGERCVAPFNSWNSVPQYCSQLGYYNVPFRSHIAIDVLLDLRTHCIVDYSGLGVWHAYGIKIWTTSHRLIDTTHLSVMSPTFIPPVVPPFDYVSFQRQRTSELSPCNFSVGIIETN